MLRTTRIVVTHLITVLVRQLPFKLAHPPSFGRVDEVIYADLNECSAQPFTVNECTVPQFWGVNYQDPTATTDAPSYMELTLDVAVDTGSGFCSTFATVGSAVAGKYSYSLTQGDH